MAGAGAVWDVTAAGAGSTALNPTVAEVGSLGSAASVAGRGVAHGFSADDADVERLRFDIPQ